MGVDVRQEAEGWGVRRERLALEQGLEEGQVGVLLALLAAKFGPVPAEVERRVREGSGDDRARWAIRVLSAADLDGVFAA